MCYVTAISYESEAEKVDDHTLLRLLCGFNLLLLIDTYALVVMRVINLCAGLLWHASAFNLHTL